MRPTCKYIAGPRRSGLQEQLGNLSLFSLFFLHLYLLLTLLPSRLSLPLAFVCLQPLHVRGLCDARTVGLFSGSGRIPDILFKIKYNGKFLGGTCQMKLVKIPPLSEITPLVQAWSVSSAMLHNLSKVTNFLQYYFFKMFSV